MIENLHHLVCIHTNIYVCIYIYVYIYIYIYALYKRSVLSHAGFLAPTNVRAQKASGLKDFRESGGYGAIAFVFVGLKVCVRQVSGWYKAGLGWYGT